MCECGELVQYGSWAGACDNEIACSVLAYVSVYRCVRVRKSVPQYGPRPPGLCTSVYFRAVRVSPAFVRCEPTKTLCFGVLYELRELFVRCEPTKALYSVRRGLCFCVLYEPSRGASLQRLCASVYRTSARSFARCEPPKALCLCVPYERQELCAMRASKGFVPLCAVGASRALCGASLQRLSTVYERQELCAVRASKGFLPCTSAKSFARCEPPKAFYRVRAPRALRGASLQRLSTVYERQELCAVRASKGFVPLCAVRASRALCDASLQRHPTVCWCSPLKICNVLVYKNLYICTVCTSSYDIYCSVREPVCLYIAERSIHVD